MIRKKLQVMGFTCPSYDWGASHCKDYDWGCSPDVFERVETQAPSTSDRETNGFRWNSHQVECGNQPLKPRTHCAWLVYVPSYLLVISCNHHRRSSQSSSKQTGPSTGPDTVQNSSFPQCQPCFFPQCQPCLRPIVWASTKMK